MQAVYDEVATLSNPKEMQNVLLLCFVHQVCVCVRSDLNITLLYLHILTLLF